MERFTAGEQAVSRETILANIAARIRTREGGEDRRGEVEDRLSNPRPNTIPARARGTPEELVARFKEMLLRVQGTTAEVSSLHEVPEAVLAYLDNSRLPLCLSHDVEALSLDWAASGFESTNWQPRQSYEVCVSTCHGGVAETGTVVIGSSPGTPLTQNFLGDVHIVLLPVTDIVGSYEELLDVIRAKAVPRHITFVSGPSCTADIEMTLEYGVHGPRRLHVLLIGA
jgi:L-lactate dehydrogenase complex protein LldG